MVCPMIEMSVGVKGQTRSLQAIKWPLHPENRTSVCVMQVFHHNQTLQLVISFQWEPSTELTIVGGLRKIL